MWQRNHYDESHNGRDSVSNHQPHHCLPNRLFRRRIKRPSKLRITGLCAGNSPVTDEVTAQMASNAENFSIWWRHHETHYSDWPGVSRPGCSVFTAETIIKSLILWLSLVFSILTSSEVEPRAVPIVGSLMTSCCVVLMPRAVRARSYLSKVFKSPASSRGMYRHTTGRRFNTKR